MNFADMPQWHAWAPTEAPVFFDTSMGDYYEVQPIVEFPDPVDDKGTVFVSAWRIDRPFECRHSFERQPVEAVMGERSRLEPVTDAAREVAAIICEATAALWEVRGRNLALSYERGAIRCRARSVEFLAAARKGTP